MGSTTDNSNQQLIGGLLVLGDGNRTVGVVEVASHLDQLQGLEHASEDDVEELHALGVLHCTHQGHCDSNGRSICPPGAAEHQLAVCNLLGQVENCSIKSSCLSEYLQMLSQQPIAMIFALDIRPVGKQLIATNL